VNTTSPDISTKDVDAFCNFCTHLRAVYRHFQILFEETTTRRELLAEVADTFFYDLNQILFGHLILQICMITDPEQSGGSKNLTIAFLVNNSDFSTNPDKVNELKQLNDRIHKFREKILPARNKFIGHLDRHSVLNVQELGAANRSEWNQFWLDLQDFVHILHKHYIDANGHFYLDEIGDLSDADKLITALKESTYFRTLQNDSELARKCADVASNSKYYEA
jgi:hypothetical protein